MTTPGSAIVALECAGLLFVAAAGMAQAPGSTPGGATQTGIAPDPIEIALERTVCYGTCPSYRVTLRDDGSVDFEGRQFTKVTGKQSWKIDPAAVRALAKEMQDAGFFEMEDDYRALVTDHPTVFTALKVGTRSKRIRDYLAGPPRLKAIEEKIDQVAGTEQYVSGDRPPR